MVVLMKLGKTLDLSKCFYDKDHWTHPDLKRGKTHYYVIVYNDTINLGYFYKSKDNEGKIWFRTDDGCSHTQFGWLDESPLQEGWKHIQEVII